MHLIGASINEGFLIQPYGLEQNNGMGGNYSNYKSIPICTYNLHNPNVASKL